MSSRARDGHAGMAAIVARIPPGEVAAEMAARFESSVAVFEHVSEDSHADIVRGLRRSLRRWARFLSTGVMPTEGDFEPLRGWARARAAEGVRLEDLLRSFGLLHQLGWQLLRRHARSDESDALLELAGLLAQYVGQISTVVTETYLAEREELVSEEERRAQSLLDRLGVDSPLDEHDAELAQRLGVPVQTAYAPFAVMLPGQRPHRHAALAARLRTAGWRLTVTHGECVLGASWKPLDLSDLGEGAEALLAIGEQTQRGGLRAALEELTVLAEHGRRIGLVGVLRAEEHLLEIIIGRSPRPVGELRRRILTPLDGGELVHTLRTLFACRLDRAATSAALHVHRNTLAYRLRRAEELTGLDLDSPRDLACLYVALQTAQARAGKAEGGPSPA
jgi:PucR C-terminal helix-turn-helix domain